MTYARIVACGSYLPKKVMTNKDIQKLVDTTDDWIVSRTGISNRRIANEHETTLTMATQASQNALSMAQLEANDIDLIICATCTPDLMFPSTACQVQAELNIQRSIIAFDISAACAGFLYALSTAEQFIRAGRVKRAMVIGSEAMSRIIDWNDRNTCILFGDGAGAFILDAHDTPGIRDFSLHSKGQYRDILYLKNAALTEEPAYLKMQGKEVFKLAVNELERSALDMLDKHNLTADDIDWFIPHQANARIISAIAKKLGLEPHKTILSLNELGNTSSASIPLAFDAALKDGRIQRGHTLLFQAIGGGMTWGTALVTF